MSLGCPRCACSSIIIHATTIKICPGKITMCAIPNRYVASPFFFYNMDETVSARVRDYSQYVILWVRENPWPSYAQMVDDIKAHENKEISMACCAAYGEYNHDILKIIYENMYDDHHIVQLGKALLARGGMQAMVCNYWVFALLSPFKHAEDLRVRNAPTRLKYVWKAIPEWADVNDLEN